MHTHIFFLGPHRIRCTQTVSPPCFGTALWTVWLAMITEDQYNDMEMASLASVHQETFGHPEIDEYAGGFRFYNT